MKIAIIVSQFNNEISNNLIEGAKVNFKENNFCVEDIDIYKVPGAFEIPGFTEKLLKQNQSYDAVLTFGSVIKGETAHFDYICKSVTDAIMKLSMDYIETIPVLYGVLTAYSYEQALDRSLLKKKDKGGEVMQAAIDYVNSLKKI